MDLSGALFKFLSKEEAVAYADREGLSYSIAEPRRRRSSKNTQALVLGSVQVALSQQQPE